MTIWYDDKSLPLWNALGSRIAVDQCKLAYNFYVAMMSIKKNLAEFQDDHLSTYNEDNWVEFIEYVLLCHSVCQELGYFREQLPRNYVRIPKCFVAVVFPYAKASLRNVPHLTVIKGMNLEERNEYNTYLQLCEDAALFLTPFLQTKFLYQGMLPSDLLTYPTPVKDEQIAEILQEMVRSAKEAHARNAMKKTSLTFIPAKHIVSPYKANTAEMDKLDLQTELKLQIYHWIRKYIFHTSFLIHMQKKFQSGEEIDFTNDLSFFQQMTDNIDDESMDDILPVAFNNQDHKAKMNDIYASVWAAKSWQDFLPRTTWEWDTSLEKVFVDASDQGNFMFRIAEAGLGLELLLERRWHYIEKGIEELIQARPNGRDIQTLHLLHYYFEDDKLQDDVWVDDLLKGKIAKDEYQRYADMNKRNCKSFVSNVSQLKEKECSEEDKEALMVKYTLPTISNPGSTADPAPHARPYVFGHQYALDEVKACTKYLRILPGEKWGDPPLVTWMPLLNTLANNCVTNSDALFPIRFYMPRRPRQFTRMTRSDLRNMFLVGTLCIVTHAYVLAIPLLVTRTRLNIATNNIDFFPTLVRRQYVMPNNDKYSISEQTNVHVVGSIDYKMRMLWPGEFYARYVITYRELHTLGRFIPGQWYKPKHGALGHFLYCKKDNVAKIPDTIMQTLQPVWFVKHTQSRLVDAWDEEPLDIATGTEGKQKRATYDLLLGTHITKPRGRLVTSFWSREQEDAIFFMPTIPVQQSGGATQSESKKLTNELLERYGTSAVYKTAATLYPYRFIFQSIDYPSKQVYKELVEQAREFNVPILSSYKPKSDWFLIDCELVKFAQDVLRKSGTCTIACAVPQNIHEAIQYVLPSLKQHIIHAQLNDDRTHNIRLIGKLPHTDTILISSFFDGHLSNLPEFKTTFQATLEALLAKLRNDGTLILYLPGQLVDHVLDVYGFLCSRFGHIDTKYLESINRIKPNGIVWICTQLGGSFHNIQDFETKLDRLRTPFLLEVKDALETGTKPSKERVLIDVHRSLELMHKLNISVNPYFNKLDFYKQFSDYMLDTIYFQSQTKHLSIPPFKGVDKLEMKKGRTYQMVDKLATLLTQAGMPLDMVSEDDYNKTTHYYSLFSGRLKKEIQRMLGIKHISQAWIKMWELLNHIRPVVHKSFVSFHACELPGAFIYALQHYMEKHHADTKLEWKAQSLKPRTTASDGKGARLTAIDDMYALYENNKSNFDLGPSGNGDLTNWENVKYYVSYVQKCDLYTADCGTDSGCARDLMFLLMLTNTYLIMHMKPGGTAILKWYLRETLTPFGTNLLALLTQAFTKVEYFHSSQNPESSELYVILHDKKASQSPNIIEWMAWVKEEYPLKKEEGGAYIGNLSWWSEKQCSKWLGRSMIVFETVITLLRKELDKIITLIKLKNSQDVNKFNERYDKLVKYWIRQKLRELML